MHIFFIYSCFYLVYHVNPNIYQKVTSFIMFYVPYVTVIAVYCIEQLQPGSLWWHRLSSFLCSNPISSRSLLLSWRDSKYLMRWEFSLSFISYNIEKYMFAWSSALSTLCFAVLCFVITKSLQPWNSTFIKTALRLGNDWSSSWNVRRALIFAA